METGSQNKTPYTPSQTKRYEVSKDEFSTKRIRALRDIYRELQAVLPIPISISIFGSLVKGKQLTAENAKDTDMDFDIKFDQEVLDALPLSDVSEFTTKFKISTENGKMKNSDLIEFIRKYVLEKINALKANLGIQEISGSHIFITPVNSTSIKSAIDARMMTESWLVPEIGVNADVRLIKYFGLSIGDAVKKYRNKFLKQLAESQNKEVAEWDWDLIRDAVESGERQGQIPDNIKKQFPQTLEEALKFYGVK